MAAGFMAGVTEALVIVTPFEVVKIRLQQQRGMSKELLRYKVRCCSMCPLAVTGCKRCCERTPDVHAAQSNGIWGLNASAVQLRRGRWTVH
jgi:Mitochondrial carrier protein